MANALNTEIVEELTDVVGKLLDSITQASDAACSGVYHAISGKDREAREAARAHVEAACKKAAQLKGHRLDDATQAMLVRTAMFAALAM